MANFHTLSIIFSSISIFFEVFSTSLIFYFKAHKKIRYEVLMYLNLFTLIHNIIHLFPYTHDNKIDDENICALQSFVASFFELSLIYLTTFISYSVYLACLKIDHLEKTICKTRIWLLGIVFVFSFPISLT